MNATVDCFQSPPSQYRYGMLFSNAISIILIIILLWALLRNRKNLWARKFILTQAVAAESLAVYLSIFMLPVPHLPHLVLRNVGLLSNFGVHGLTQYAILAQLILFEGSLILETYRDRFKNMIIESKLPRMYYYLTVGNWIYHVFAVLHIAAVLYFYSDSIEIIEAGKTKLIQQYPEVPIEITCQNVMIAVMDEHIPTGMVVFYTFMAFWVIAIVAVNTGYFFRYVKNRAKLSADTKRSVAIRVIAEITVNMVMLWFPVIVQTYAVFFKMESNTIALVLLYTVAYHGICSYIVSLLTLKPLREQIFCGKRNTTSEVYAISMNRL